MCRDDQALGSRTTIRFEDLDNCLNVVSGVHIRIEGSLSCS